MKIVASSRKGMEVIFSFLRMFNDFAEQKATNDTLKAVYERNNRT